LTTGFHGSSILFLSWSAQNAGDAAEKSTMILSANNIYSRSDMTRQPVDIKTPINPKSSMKNEVAKTAVTIILAFRFDKAFRLSGSYS
jgi:hypothetical protein